MIGKWHLGSHAPFLPNYNGFDHWFGLPYSNDMWPYHPMMPPQPNEDDRMKAARARAAYTGYAGQGHYYDLEKGQGFPEKLPLMSDDEVLEYNPDLTQITKRYTDRALTFIEQNKDKPFFLYLPHAMPHVPLFVSEERRASRAAASTATSSKRSTGRSDACSTSSKTGIDDKTLVVFTSDNGPWLQYGVDGGSAGPFRDGKGTTFEGGMRVPGIFRWPGKIPAGQVSAEPVANMDILPTFARLAGKEAPTDRVIDGRDLWPLLSGQPGARSPHEQFYYFGGGRDRANIRAVREGRWKLHVQRAGGAGELEPVALYDLQEDASEKFDRKELHPDFVRRLLSITDEFVRNLEAHVRPLGGS